MYAFTFKKLSVKRRRCFLSFSSRAVTRKVSVTERLVTRLGRYFSRSERRIRENIELSPWIRRVNRYYSIKNCAQKA